MHRTIQISLPSSDAQKLCDELARLETVVGVSLNKNGSIKPPGDVVTVDVLNKGADDVLKIVRTAARADEFSIVTHEAASFIDPSHQHRIESDVDEAVWEEMETGLRHQGRITWNFVFLMALGGAIAAVGLVSDPSPQALAFAAAGIIAPGFEPLAKIPLGAILGRWAVVRRGALSALVGYAVLIASAAFVTFALLATHTIETSELLKNPEVKNIAEPTLKEFTVSGAGALAGIIIIAAYRRSVIAGALIALVMIPAAALIGAGFAAGESKLALEGLERLGMDVLFVVAAGLLIFWLKQKLVHNRKPLV